MSNRYMCLWQQLKSAQKIENCPAKDTLDIIRLQLQQSTQHVLIILPTDLPERLGSHTNSPVFWCHGAFPVHMKGFAGASGYFGMKGGGCPMVRAVKKSRIDKNNHWFCYCTWSLQYCVNSRRSEKSTGASQKRQRHCFPRDSAFWLWRYAWIFEANPVPSHHLTPRWHPKIWRNLRWFHWVVSLHARTSLCTCAKVPQKR